MRCLCSLSITLPTCIPIDQALYSPTIGSDEKGLDCMMYGQ